MNFKEKIRAFIYLYIHDLSFRGEISLYLNVTFNLIYALFLVISGFLYRSHWTSIMAFYYVVVAIMRMYLVIKNVKSKPKEKWRGYSNCGYIMFLLAFVLIGISISTLSGEHVISYPYHIIYVIALVTFLNIISAIKEVLIYKRINDPILLATKMIRISTALISLYILQTAMIEKFSDDREFFVIMGLILGLIICMLLLYFSIKMIIHGNNELKKQAE